MLDLAINFVQAIEIAILHATSNQFHLACLTCHQEEEEEEEARDTFDPEPPMTAMGASRAAADEVRQFESATSEWMRATTEKLREENGDRFAEASLDLLSAVQLSYMT